MTFDRDALDEMSIDAQRELRDGNADRAADLFRQLVAAWTAIEGPDGEAVLNWRGWVAQSLIAARRYSAAEEVLYQLLDDRARVLGVDHPSVLVARGNLSKAIGLAGRPDEALLVAERLLADRERLFGADESGTLATRGNIGALLMQAGRTAEAISVLEALLEDRIRVLGENHHATLTTEDNLWSARLLLPDPTAAIEEMLERAGADEAEFGEDDPDAMVSYAKVAEAMMRVDRHAEALPLLDKVVRVRHRAFGADDIRTLSAQRLRALALYGLGDVEAAHDEIWQGIDVLHRLRRDGEIEAGHFYVDALSIDIARLHSAAGAKREEIRLATVLARERLSSLLPSLEADHPLRALAAELFAALDAPW